MLAPLLDQIVEVATQLAPRPFDRLAGRLPRAAVLGVVLADDLVRPLEQQPDLFTRHSQRRGDDREGKRRGDALDEVELAGGGEAVEDVDRDGFDVLPPGPNRARRERR